MERIDLSKLKAMRLSENFVLWEFTHDSKASAYGIYNVPDANGIAKLKNICNVVLQPIRNHFAVAVSIVNGFRSPRLNTLWNGAPNSQHMLCEAVDFRVRGISPNVVAKWIAENLDYDVMMFEYLRYDADYTGPAWIHLSYVSPEKNRRLNLTTEAGLKTFKLSENFSLWEMVRSDTAHARKIFNVPDEAGIEKLRQLCLNILQPVRNALKRPIRVNSAYRSPKLNAVVRGASKTSQHMRCEAVDFEIMGMDNFELAQWVRENLIYDQLILEFYGDDSSDPNDGWVHTSYTATRKNRMMDLTINLRGTRPGLHHH